MSVLSSETAPALFPRDAPPRALASFDILQRLGAGGVGEVFLARSRAGKLVAIKTIADARRDGHEGETADAFAREASVCVRLRHPCIVQVRAFLEEPGFAALVFEYVPGVALARLLRLCQSTGVRLPDLAAWHVTERVLTALAYAHDFKDDGGPRTPIIHRDVSPSNVLVDWTGGVKIADFGLAKVLGVSPGTRVGIVKGTLGCMAPEQARGEQVDERADVYAAALLAWRLATGRVPFAKHQKDEWEMLRAMRNPRIPPLASLRPDLPEPLLDAVARALEPEREQRTITAAELADVVRAHVDVGAGWIQLAQLLDKCKGALERSVKRKDRDKDKDRDSGHVLPTIDAEPSSGGGRAAMTLRYEEVALAFDDDAPEDGPTFEAHALPSDPAMLAAMPVAQGDDVAGPAVAAPPTDPDPVDPFEHEPPSDHGFDPEPASRSASGSESPSHSVEVHASEPPPPAQSTVPTVPPAAPERRRISPVVAVVACLAVGLAAAILAFYAR